MWRVLKPGGKLLYATCSLFPQENNRQIDAWLGGHPDARRLALPPTLAAPGAPPFEPHGVAGQLLPGPLHDGFFYALLGKA
jgi:16S rRNA (cytosine967-C5)-methyltransferase